MGSRPVFRPQRRSMELMQPPLRDIKDLFCDWTVCGLWPLPHSAAHNEDDPDGDDYESDADFGRRVVRIGNFYGRNDRFTRPELQPVSSIHRVIEHDLYRNTLDDLHIVACCILRRQETESSSAAGLDAINMPTKFLAMQRIHFDFDRLPGSHAAYLIFFEVRSDKDLLRHKREQALSSLHVLSGHDRLFGDPARLGRQDPCIGLV